MATATKTTGSQFDGLLAPRKRPQPEEPEAAPVDTNDTAPKSRPSAAKKETKSLAKSKDDAYQGRTFYVRKKTYAECDYALRSTTIRAICQTWRKSFYRHGLPKRLNVQHVSVLVL